MWAKTIIENPVAAAKCFKILIDAFLDIILGFKHSNKIGVFGKVDSYYGVVKAQGPGSLHCHFFIWLYGGLSPYEVRDKALSDLA
jgi:hypothetical protein